MNCKICSSTSQPFAHGVVLQKHRVSYFKCKNCGFVQTEEPYWLNEAYSEAINLSDVGLVSRNIRFAKIAKALIAAFFNSDGRFIDYGAGYGLFVRMMRDLGYDFCWHDRYCENLFAKGFESAQVGADHFELLTAFELFEHFTTPQKDIAEMLKLSRNILFSTELLPAAMPKPGDWWYYGLEHGQHISLFTHKSLSILAEQYDLNFYSNGTSVHLFTDKRISSLIFKLFTHYKLALLLDIVVNKRSLVQDDYASLTKSSTRV